MKFFSLPWQPAQVLTTLPLENAVLKPSSGCTLLLLLLSTAFVICEKSPALLSPYLSPGQGEVWAGARRVPIWASKVGKESFPLKEEGEGRLGQLRVALSMCAVLLRLA